MLAKTITYEDLDGNSVTETFYFHFNKAELSEMAVDDEADGFAEKIKRLSVSQDKSEILRLFKDIIRRSVGYKSEDGKRFIKTEEYTEAFMASEAWAELFYTFISDANAAVEFVTSVVPKNLIPPEKKTTQVLDVLPQMVPDESVPIWVRENREPTDAEAVAAPEHLFRYIRAMQHTPKH
jgi:hypothetical protein